ncbi:hypothetical protein sos41_25420 [Alphaproteobacteria bacterium SO-S41]|nr:hypothetical protein sos41_25420 [Alphaproteobacteria bacterium SO-S41]
MSGAGAVLRRLARVARRTLRDAGLGAGLSARKARKLIADSGVFDAAWYRARYPAIGTADPLRHYLKRGAAAGHDPSPLFWTAWYAARYPEAARFGGGPLAHYLTGRGTGPNPVFDDARYTADAGNLGGHSALAHYVKQGAAAGLDPHPLFETEWYRARYANQLKPDQNPLAHFLATRGGFDPGPHFQSDFYRARYPDIAAADINPLAHFLLGGAGDLRDPSLHFCTARYLRQTPAARVSPYNPLVHAVLNGYGGEPAPSRPPPPPATARLTLTAIVPNYNHARFLKERLDSIFAQTVLPDEVIFLDDQSTDDSLAVAQAYAARAPMPFRIVPAEANSGSPFGQWAKGLALATTDLVWMAESDDRCAPTLIAMLKPAFDDPAVTLAYAQSRPIAGDGRALAPDYRDYTDDLSLTRWRTPYVAEGRDEVLAALAHRNTIPNGSAVLMRRSATAEAATRLTQFRQCGDWFVYLACAGAGHIAFAPEPLNDHRRHAGALTLELSRSLAAFAEVLTVRLETLRFDLPDDVFLASLAAIAAEYHERMGGYLGTPPPLTTQELFAPALATFRAEANRRFGATPRTLAIIETAYTATPPAAPEPATFLAGVRPAPEEPAWPGLTWIEGGARAWIWSAPALWAGNDAAADPRRIAVLATLADILQVKTVTSAGPQSARLAAAVAARAGLPAP